MTTRITGDPAADSRLTARLRQAQKMEAVGRLVGGVTHDFNNLLTAINGYSELILAQMAEDDPQHFAVAEIRKAGKRAAELTQRLLALTRTRPPSPRKTDLNRVVTDLEKLLRRVLGEDIALTTRLDPELRPIHVDPGQIEHVLLNLAIHARGLMPGGGRLAIETTNHSRASGEAPSRSDYALLTVRHSPTGGEPRSGERAAEPGRPEAEPELEIARDIVRECGGSLEPEPAGGAGRTFRSYLPQIDEPEHGALAGGPHNEPEVLPRGHETVLLVEDEGSVRSLVKRILERQGYRVLAAQNARDAIEICDALDGWPDLLLTDVVMPERSGRALAEDLRKRCGGLKILFMSGYPDSQSGVPLVNERQAAFLPKPFSPEALAHKVRETLDRG